MFDIDKYHSNFCIKCKHCDRKNISVCSYYKSVWYGRITECVDDDTYEEVIS